MSICRSCKEEYFEVAEHHYDRLLDSMVRGGDKIGAIILIRAHDGSTLAAAKFLADGLFDKHERNKAARSAGVEV